MLRNAAVSGIPTCRAKPVTGLGSTNGGAQKYYNDCTMNLQQGRQRRPRRWDASLLYGAFFVWVTISLVFAVRIFLVKGPTVTPKANGDTNINPQSLTAPPDHSMPVAVDKYQNESIPTTKHSINYDQRISGLAPPLAHELLHGGWQYDQQVFDSAIKHPNATVISLDHPRAILIKGFLSSDEIQDILSIAEGGFQRSEVVSDGEVVSNARTSYGVWLNGPRRTDTVLRIQNRIAQVTGIPEDFGEAIYVLRYATGQKYEAHTDHCHHFSSETLTPACRSFLARAGGPGCGPGAGGVTCGDRLATFILYLKSPIKGGATAFPLAAKKKTSASVTRSLLARMIPGQTKDSNLRAEGPEEKTVEIEEGPIKQELQSPYCDEDSDTLKVIPQAGDAILFYDYVPMDAPEYKKDVEDLPEMTEVNDKALADPTSAHAGCPPLKGTKIIATRWMRSAQFL